MDLSSQRDGQHVWLPTACSIVYASITGATPNATNPAELQRVLNDVARAMAYVVRIFANEGGGVPRAIGGFDAMRGAFIRGAHAFRTSEGREIASLTVQRRAMTRAIEVLR